FSGGRFDPTGPRMAAVGGGPLSGWMSQSQRLTPMTLKTWRGHYTPNPTIYIRADGLVEPDRLALRLRDEQGQYWIAEPESQGVSEGVHPFLLKVPPEVTNVVLELVFLRPIKADFLVRTKTTPTP